MKKSEVYAQYGIKFEKGKIFSEKFNAWINPLLVDGNSKLGKGIYTFSTLPTNQIFHVVIYGKPYDVKGTCVCSCNGCYATKGFYNMPSVLQSNALKTILCYEDLQFVKNAIIAQIKAENISFVRIHASGDFFSERYIEVWQDIARECEDTIFWTYTKNEKAVSMFDGFSNANIVKSIIKGYGFNFGHCDYILKVYKALKAQGKAAYICRCGIDKNQHCTNCKGCSKNEFVLFIEHSTEYQAEKDPMFEELKAIIDSQEKP